MRYGIDEEGDRLYLYRMVKKQRSKGLYQRRDYTDEELVNLGFRAPGLFVRAVHRAAEKEKSRSTSEWLHHVVAEATAKTLGVTVDSFDPERRPMVDDQPSPAAVAELAEIKALMAGLTDRLAKIGVGAAAPAEPKTRRR